MKRYDLDPGKGYQPIAKLLEEVDGDWVRFDDAQADIRAAVEEERRRLVEDILMVVDAEMGNPHTLGARDACRAIRERIVARWAAEKVTP